VDLVLNGLHCCRGVGYFRFSEELFFSVNNATLFGGFCLFEISKIRVSTVTTADD